MKMRVMLPSLRGRWLPVAVLVSALGFVAPSVALANYAPAPGNPSNNGSLQTAYGPLAPGQTYSGTLVDSTQLDYYYYYARPQDRVTLSETDSQGYVTAFLMDPAGNSICDGEGAVLGQPNTCTPAAYPGDPADALDGLYYVGVTPTGAVTPVTYNITVSGPLSGHNPVSCSAANSRLTHDVSLAHKYLLAARNAKRHHQSARYRREQSAYHHQQNAVAHDRTRVRQRCSG